MISPALYLWNVQPVDRSGLADGKLPPIPFAAPFVEYFRVSWRQAAAALVLDGVAMDTTSNMRTKMLIKEARENILLRFSEKKGMPFIFPPGYRFRIRFDVDTNFIYRFSDVAIGHSFEFKIGFALL